MDYDKLIKETSMGNMESLEKLYKDLGPTVYGLALSILRSKTLAEDVLQDTFVRVKLSAYQLRPGTNGRAWILRIARNLSISVIRSRKYEIYGSETEDAWNDGVDHTQDSLDSLILKEALFKLDEDERQIVLLHAVKDLKHREIAQITGLPLGTVLWKYRRAISKMSGFLKTGSVDAR